MTTQVFPGPTRFATSQKDLDSRDGPADLVKITYMGIWDTVGALGLPVALFGPVAQLWHHRHAFHDTELSSLAQRSADQWGGTVSSPSP